MSDGWTTDIVICTFQNFFFINKGQSQCEIDLMDDSLNKIYTGFKLWKKSSFAKNFRVKQGQKAASCKKISGFCKVFYWICKANLWNLWSLFH